MVFGDLDWVPTPDDCGMRPLRDQYKHIKQFDRAYRKRSSTWAATTARIGLQHNAVSIGLLGVGRVLAWAPTGSEASDRTRLYQSAQDWLLAHPCFHPDIANFPDGDPPGATAGTEWLPPSCEMTVQPWMFPEGSRLKPLRIEWTWAAGLITPVGCSEATPTKPQRCRDRRRRRGVRFARLGAPGGRESVSPRRQEAAMRGWITMLIPLFLATPAIAEPSGKPGATCGADWLKAFSHSVREVYRGQVADPGALIEEIATAVTKAGGVITMRRELNGAFDLNVTLSGDLDLEALIDAHGPVWEHRERTEQQLRLDDECRKLEAAKTVSARLTTWLAEDLSPHEQQYVLQIHQNHRNLANRIQQQLDNRKNRNDGRTVQVHVSKIGSVDPRRRR